ncbi:MAG: hypothetical protein ACJ77K_18145 [Bacteroidia bacterium]
MKKPPPLFSVILILVLFASCKAPLPIYFDRPVGTLLDSFPQALQGNYYIMDQVVSPGLDLLQKTYTIRNGRIDSADAFVPPVPKDTSHTAVPEEVKVDNAVNDSGGDLSEIANLNSLSSGEYLLKLIFMSDLSYSEKANHPNEREKSLVQFSFIKATASKVTIVAIDTLQKLYEEELFCLSDDIKLSVYAGDYYVNIRTPNGWEYLRIELWSHGRYLNVSSFYFTSYNDRTNKADVFLKSTAQIYPKMKLIYNEEKKITGLKAKSNPAAVKAAFSNSEGNFELIRAR